VLARLLHRAAELIRAGLDALDDIWALLVSEARKAWAAHTRLLESNDGYRSALLAGAAGVLTQVRPDRMVVAAVMALIAILAAARQEPHGRISRYGDDWDQP
jgi:hypothetical protein